MDRRAHMARLFHHRWKKLLPCQEVIAACKSAVLCAEFQSFIYPDICVIPMARQAKKLDQLFWDSSYDVYQKWSESRNTKIITNCDPVLFQVLLCQSNDCRLIYSHIKLPNIPYNTECYFPKLRKVINISSMPLQRQLQAVFQWHRRQWHWTLLNRTVTQLLLLKPVR